MEHTYIDFLLMELAVCFVPILNPLIKKRNRLDNAGAGSLYTCFLHDQQWSCSIEYQLQVEYQQH